MYQGIIRVKREIPHTTISKWEEEAGEKMDHGQWLKGLLYFKNHTMCSKIRSHMYKFALRDVSYNARLFKMKLVDSPNCKWCPGTKESLLHLYWKCPKASKLWSYVEEATSIITGTRIIVKY